MRNIEEREKTWRGERAEALAHLEKEKEVIIIIIIIDIIISIIIMIAIMTIMMMHTIMMIIVESVHTSIYRPLCLNLTWCCIVLKVVRADLLAEIHKKGESLAAKLDKVQK